MKRNILFVVEGQETETKFFEQVSKCFSFDYNIRFFGTNIYSLYKRMKEIDFNGDIKDILIEMHPEQKTKLSKKYTYTYLIFDCDVHHKNRGDIREIEEVVHDNLTILKEMVNYFVDETDPSIGKLYINYPMMESYKDCDEFFDNNYASNVVRINDLLKYKEIVSIKKLSGKHLQRYKKEDFQLLILQNVYKINKLINNKWKKPSYNEYQRLSEQNTILEKEKELFDIKRMISVLNTSLFIVLDYFGNRNGFYDSINLK